jgi:hypothetical protein
MDSKSRLFIQYHYTVQIYNTSIKNAAVNEEWLYSYLVPMLKPGKDHTKVQSYSIITMQNTVNKLLEKIISRKITHQLERLRLLPPNLGV